MIEWINLPSIMKGDEAEMSPRIGNKNLYNITKLLKMFQNFFLLQRLNKI